MLHLSLIPDNMDSIQEASSIVGTAPVTSFVGSHWASGQLWLFDLTGALEIRDQVNVWQQLFVPTSKVPKGCNMTSECCDVY